MPMSERELSIVRDLAKRYRDVCAREVQRERRDLWRRHNSLQRTRPLIYARAFAWAEMPQSRCECEDPLYRHYESFFQYHLFRDALNDDFIFEPWVTLQATRVTPAGGVWGVSHTWTGRGDGHAGIWDSPIKRPEDVDLLVEPHHVIDEEATARNAERLHDALGDILPVCVDRAPVYRVWDGDISTQLAYLRGLEQIMWDMVDRPEWLHGLLAFMRDGILRTHREAEEAGDWRLCDHENQAMRYSLELHDPAADGPPVTRKDLWWYCASQETTAVGPAMFDEFMFQYQMPVLKEFGLVAYGCCEDLTQKIDVLRQLPNLRRIAVAPAADVARCAEQIGQDYVLSYRPSPADMVAYGFEPDRVRRILRRDLGACRDCHVDITLKDVETVQGDPTRVRRWVVLAREVIDELF